MQRIEIRMEEIKRGKNIKLVEQAESELKLIEREKELAEMDFGLENIFNTYGKSAMMSAKFYYECMCLKIPCVLDVHTQHGEVDAIIEIKSNYYIIEFKSYKRQAREKKTIDQLSRYLKYNYPVILIYESNLFSTFLTNLKFNLLRTMVYVYTCKGFEVFKY